jgi:hypothetical protein
MQLGPNVNATLKESNMPHRLEEDREGVWGFLIQENTFYSEVRFSVGGIEYNTCLENDEYFIPDQIGYEKG